MCIIGIKVWIFRGELESGQWSPPNIKAQTDRGGQERGERGPLKSGRRSRKAG
ncbi:MAG: hypothetical protein R3D26_21455 [Cyanobacteriota/Melainabacteria group bacterium]